MTKQSDIEMVAKARAWAVKAHAGQKDKAGQEPTTNSVRCTTNTMFASMF